MKSATILMLNVKLYVKFIGKKAYNPRFKSDASTRPVSLNFSGLLNVIAQLNRNPLKWEPRIENSIIKEATRYSARISFYCACTLGALALDEWREDNERQELADRAQAAIVREFLDNKKQLDEKRPIHSNMLEVLIEKLDIYQKDGNKSPNFDFNYTMVFLSSAAWDTARTIQSAQFMPFENISQYSKIYRLQQLYIENQQKLIEMIMDIGDLEDNEFGKFTKGFIHRLTLLIEINEKLSKAYKQDWFEFRTAILFGLWHGLNGSDNFSISMNWIPFVYTGVMGFVFGLVKERTGSLVYPILLHLIVNILPNTMGYVF